MGAGRGRHLDMPTAGAVASAGLTLRAANKHTQLLAFASAPEWPTGRDRRRTLSGPEGVRWQGLDDRGASVFLLNVKEIPQREVRAATVVGQAESELPWMLVAAAAHLGDIPRRQMVG